MKDYIFPILKGHDYIAVEKNYNTVKYIQCLFICTLHIFKFYSPDVLTDCCLLTCAKV